MNKKLYVVAIIFALIVSCFAINSNAADYTFSTEIQANSSQIKKGTPFEINIQVKNIKAGNNGINSVSGTFVYDKEVFEELTSDSFEGLNDWTVKYNSADGKITFLKTSFVKETQALCKVTLKTKSDTTATKTSVELKDFEASNSEGITAKATGISKSYNISSSGSTNQITSITPVNNNSNNNASTKIVANTNKNTNKNNTNNTNVNTNQSKENEMPDTGLDDSIVKAILLIGVVGMFGYIKFRSLDRKEK